MISEPLQLSAWKTLSIFKKCFALQCYMFFKQVSVLSSLSECLDDIMFGNGGRESTFWEIAAHSV